MPDPTTATTATVPQPPRALGLANTHRSAAAVLRTRLRQRTISLREILEDPPDELGRYPTWEVLLWAPGIGRNRLRALNVRAIRQGHVNLAATLGAHRPPAPMAGRAAPRTPMTGAGANGLVMVHAREVVNPILAGRDGREYTSPPQPREQALALVAVLLRSPARDSDDGWSCPVVGGRLTIRLLPAG